MADLRIERILSRLEPHTPPSQRFYRVVHVGSVEVFEMRDPNDGLGDPSSKTRYQYLHAGDGTWARTLPPERRGDCWEGQDAPPVWTRLMAARGLLFAEIIPFLPQASLAVLQRLSMSDGREYIYCVKGALVEREKAGDILVVMGPITDAWWDVPLPQCPDCGGAVLCAEAGYAPGARQCNDCGSLFSVEVRRPAERRAADVDAVAKAELAETLAALRRAIDGGTDDASDHNNLFDDLVQKIREIGIEPDWAGHEDIEQQYHVARGNAWP